MATSMEFGGWREQLSKHPLCKALKENNAKDSAHKNATDSKSIFCINGSDLFVWDSSDKCLLHCNLKTLQKNSEVEKVVDKIDQLRLGKKTEESYHYQKLLLNDIVSFDVEGIRVNSCGSYIVVWGHHGIRVVQLPSKWGKNSMFEGGKKEAIPCRTIKIGERHFTGHKNLSIRQVSWHPGSKTNSHLTLLTTDNMFSVYNLSEPDEPSSIININTGEINPTYSPSKSFVAPVLGETAVAFDFGKPIEVQPRQKRFSCPNLEVWPVYCVRGNGDVLILYSHLSNVRPVRFPVQGPLTMNPPADDNYGVDACSIVCLPTSFPVIIISTMEGRVHHCVQLPGAAEDESEQEFPNTSSLYGCPPEPSLYVIETAELDLCLSVSKFEEDSSLDNDFMCPVHLKKDPSCPDRYLCAHAAGVHCVALPWLTAVQNFFLEEDEDLSMPEEKECIIEHLVCTKPLYSCPTSPILGVDTVTDPLLGTTLLVLTCDYEFTALPMGLHYKLYPSHSESSSLNSSKVQPRNLEPFSHQVKQILLKKDSHPLLKSSNTTEQSQKNCFRMLIQATQILRQEYIPRIVKAKQAIDARVALLKNHKTYHLEDIKRLIEASQELREHAGIIADRLETTKENHERLFKRLDSVVHKLQNNVPVLSDAEKQMIRELNRIKDNIQIYEQSIQQVKSKQELQDKQMNRANKSSGPFLHQSQLGHIYGVLKEEGDDIEELRKEVTRLNLTLS
ncbi:nuclear pore complex protein Nup88 [Biomphalaria pfeifferi]|uniref:Nuclear pore complex protein Nup88 n=1 Tax=Biomphalaria pfeifferi TaxID=112525 RepID=A0AAD8ARQ9_BIOPF|nr:nuclear pore complex protein Nup88 [Biomphalaria pfeifferi]